MSNTATIPTSSNVADYLLDVKPGDLTALDLLTSSHNYAELQSASSKVAEFLVSTGGNKGDRALLVADNSFFWVASYLGILRAGLVCVPLPLGIAGEDLGYILQNSSPRFAFLQSSFYSKFRSELHATSVVVDSLRADNSSEPLLYSLPLIVTSESDAPAALPTKIEKDDLAALMFTSGSTARPRGVMVTHGNIIANTNSIIQYLNLTRNDSILVVLPFHYCFGTSLLHTHLKVGGRLVIDNRFMYPEAVLRRMQTTSCTGFAGVPSHYQILLRRSAMREMRFPHLRYMQQAGGHLAPAFIRELRQALPDTRLFVMYGQTEATARLAYLPPEMLERKLGSIGIAIPGVKLSIVNEQGEQVAAGEQGEIVAEGKNIAAGYWGDPEESRVSFRDGRLHTGDLARADEDGYIYISDRARDFVKIGGKRTSCRHIEEQLLEFEGLLEVAVIGMPDEIAGEALKAFVVPRDRNNACFLEQLRHFCAERLPFRYVPKEIVQLNALPKNSAGKVLKASLKNGAQFQAALV